MKTQYSIRILRLSGNSCSALQCLWSSQSLSRFSLCLFRFTRPTPPESSAKSTSGSSAAAADLYGTGIRVGICLQTIGLLLSALWQSSTSLLSLSAPSEIHPIPLSRKVTLRNAYFVLLTFSSLHPSTMSDQFQINYLRQANSKKTVVKILALSKYWPINQFEEDIFLSGI